uniref:Putative secreted protein n=1 Tax=Amblyomma cajennense TaxID=34607 RepID=A0A023FBX4_AMBCJ
MKLEAAALCCVVLLATVLSRCTGLHQSPYRSSSELGTGGFNNGYYPGAYGGGYPGYYNYLDPWQYPGSWPEWGFGPYRPQWRRCGRTYCPPWFRCERKTIYCVRAPCPQPKPRCVPRRFGSYQRTT